MFAYMYRCKAIGVDRLSLIFPSSRSSLFLLTWSYTALLVLYTSVAGSVKILKSGEVCIRRCVCGCIGTSNLVAEQGWSGPAVMCYPVWIKSISCLISSDRGLGYRHMENSQGVSYGNI